MTEFLGEVMYKVLNPIKKHDTITRNNFCHGLDSTIQQRSVSTF